MVTDPSLRILYASLERTMMELFDKRSGGEMISCTDAAKRMVTCGSGVC